MGIGGKSRTLGRFNDELTAAKTYDKAARQALGEFARLNFPNSAAVEHPKWVDRHEARRMFGVALPTWKSWERDGLVRGKRTSYRVFYDVEQLMRLLPQLGPIDPPYPEPHRPGCWRAPLVGRGPYRRRGEAIIDAETLPLIQGRTLSWCDDDDPAGAYVCVSWPGDSAPLRRIVLGIVDAQLQVGHVNGDALDCRRANLVVQTISQRLRRARKRATHAGGQPCTSRFKGVSWIKREEKWRARISVDGRERHLGRFRYEIAAAQAYDAVARELFGEHARVNFPDRFDAATSRRAA